MLMPGFHARELRPARLEELQYSKHFMYFNWQVLRYFNVKRRTDAGRSLRGTAFVRIAGLRAAKLRPAEPYRLDIRHWYTAISMEL